MVDISHKNLSGTQLHETKGVSAATNYHVATCQSAATTWAFLDHNSLTTTGNPFGGQLFHTRYQKTAGTDGGSVTTSTWTKYPLSTSVTNEITSASLASSVLSLPTGTYRCKGFVQSVEPGNGKLRLRNTTNGTTLVVGQNYRCSSASNDGATLVIEGTFTISGTKNIELQYWITNSTGVTALGLSMSTGEIEVYGDLEIWKIS